MPSTPSATRADLLRLPPGRILLACSGGADSLGLALLAGQVASPQRLAICHVDHRLRPERERLSDRRAVRAVAERLGVPVYIRSAPPAPPGGNGPEDAARRVRYALLNELLRMLNCSWIATAHHQRDQLETILMRLVDGAPAESTAGIPGIHGCVIRPVLDRSPQELADVLSASGFRPSPDSSNRDAAFRRNRIRAGIGPALTDELRQHGPGFARGISATHRDNADRLAWLRRELRPEVLPLPLLESQLSDSGPSPTWRCLPLPALLRLPSDLRTRALALVLQDAGGRFRIPWERLRSLAGHPREGRYRFGALRVLISGQTLIVHPHHLPAEPARAWELVVRNSPGWGRHCLPYSGGDPAEVRIRSALPGDRLPVAGGTRRLGDVCRDLGIPASLRPLVPVVELHGGVILAFTAALGRQYPLPTGNRAGGRGAGSDSHPSWFCLDVRAW